MEEFFETDAQYHSGFVINEYNGKVSLIAAKKPQDKVYQSWGDIEIGKDKTKRLPVKVELGGSRIEAIATLRDVLKRLVDESDIPF